MNSFKNMIRAGVVSTVDAKRCTVRVSFPDQEGMVSDELPLLLQRGDYTLPAVNDSVLCLFLGNGIQIGFCLGTYYMEDIAPPQTNPDRVGTWFPGGSYVYFDKATNALHIKAVGEVQIESNASFGADIHIQGGATIGGNVTINGNLNVSGTITHGGLNP